MVTRLNTYYTKFPNHLFACSDISPNARLVALALLYRAGDGSDSCWPSQTTIANDIGMGRKAVNGAVAELRRFGLKTAWKRVSNGKTSIMHYDVSALRKTVEASRANCACGRHLLVEYQNDTGASVKTAQGSVSERPTNKKQRTTTKEQAAPPAIDNREPTSPSIVETTDEPEVLVVKGSAERSVPSADFDKHFGPNAVGSIGPDDPFPFGDTPFQMAAPARSIWDELDEPLTAPKVTLDKRLVNDELLTPGGLHASDNIDDLYYDLNWILFDVCGEKFNRVPGDPKTNALGMLISKHGARYVAFWAHWLSRKVAAEYERGKPVKTPTALLIKAIEEGWQVDPSWPDFDADLHTWCAADHLAEQAKFKAA